MQIGKRVILNTEHPYLPVGVAGQIVAMPNSEQVTVIWDLRGSNVTLADPRPGFLLRSPCTAEPAVLLQSRGNFAPACLKVIED